MMASSCKKCKRHRDLLVEVRKWIKDERWGVALQMIDQFNEEEMHIAVHWEAPETD
jgi:hypothetical protein